MESWEYWLGGAIWVLFFGGLAVRNIVRKVRRIRSMDDRP